MNALSTGGFQLKFLLTPLREGRLVTTKSAHSSLMISTHAPAGGATPLLPDVLADVCISTHAPAGGATSWGRSSGLPSRNFYSRPCGRGDQAGRRNEHPVRHFYSRPCGRGDRRACRSNRYDSISTHAPAGGATAIFHKSVMRFCGKLPKDDTVLCLASFGFPRRDPKAVYLAWISCANLPQKCVRQGLALKDQGTSCFHEGLASHAFDPVLV